jgi:hypothetical protein
VLENLSHNYGNDESSSSLNAQQQLQAQQRRATAVQKNHNNRISVDHTVWQGDANHRQRETGGSRTTTEHSKPRHVVNTNGAVVVAVDAVLTSTEQSPERPTASSGEGNTNHEQPNNDKAAVGFDTAATAATTRTTKDGRILPVIALSDLQHMADATSATIDRSKIGRGVSAATKPSPLLADAQRAHVECDINVDALAYWNVGEKQPDSPNPFKSEGYITFAPDNGGWNNVRQIIVVGFAVLC